jgi:alginate O-acetyltransferase complex protein AlgI
LIFVFFLTGLWHGASWSFVVWGLWHGAFLVIERAGFGKILERTSRPLRYVYTLLVVLIGWVLFRSDSLSLAWSYIQAMFGYSQDAGATAVTMFINTKVLLALIAGCIGAMPLARWLSSVWEKAKSLEQANAKYFGARAFAVITVLVFMGIFFLSSMQLASGTYNPFIYFRF